MLIIDYIKYRQKLAKFFKQKEKVRAAFAVEIRNAQKQKKPWKEIQPLEHQAWFEEEMVDEEISILVSDYMFKKAKRKFIPLPSFDEPGMWEKCSKVTDRSVLTNAGISKLRSSLRAERKERHEMLLSILAALTGIIGAATGLIAIWLK